MGTNRKIQKLFDQKKKVEKEIEKIQNNCRHPSQQMKFIYPNQKSHLTELRWVCEECELPLGWPSKEESEKFLTK